MFAATMKKDRSQNRTIPGMKPGSNRKRNRAAIGTKPGSNRNEAGQHPEWARSWLGVARSSWAPLGAARMVTTRSLRGHHAVTTRSQRGHDADAVTTRSRRGQVTTRFPTRSQHGHNIPWSHHDHEVITTRHNAVTPAVTTCLSSVSNLI